MQLDAVIVSLKVRAFIFKIESQTSTRGYVAYTSFRGKRATTPYPPTLFEHMKSPLKRKRMHYMNRFHRTLEVKKRKLDEREKMDAAESLLMATLYW